MTDNEVTGSIDIPKLNNWLGPIGSYKAVRPYIKNHIWDFVSAVGLLIIVVLVAQIILNVIFKHDAYDTIVNQVVGLLAGTLFQTVVITMYFKSLHNHDFTLSEAIVFGYHRMFKMLGLLIVMYVILIVSFILFIVPFIFILPRIYLAPYFLIYNDSTVAEAFAASWHLSKGHYIEIFGIVILDIVIALAALTIIGIPFAVYWWIINSASFAFLTMYLTQPNKPKKKKLTSRKVSPA